MFLDAIRYMYRRGKFKTPVWLGLGEKQCGLASKELPFVSIVIPTRDRLDLLKTCLDSILNLTAYPNFEVVVLDNDSVEPSTLSYLSNPGDERVKVFKSPGPFNYSRIMNRGVNQTLGDVICVMNNDTVVTKSQWLTNMVNHLDDTSVGVVGALLTYPSGLIQHAGIALGYTGAAGHVYSGLPISSIPTKDCFEVSAVTFACAVIKRANWQKVKGLDERYKVGLNDVDFCLRLRAVGLSAVVCKSTELIHLESQSRQSVMSLKGFVRAATEVQRFTRVRRRELKADSYFVFETDSAD